MATTQFGLLEERDEGELHKIRLLNVEEKPFKRVTKRLVAPGAFTNPNSTKLATPPPENSGGGAEGQDENNNNNSNQLSADDIASLKEDITLDFAAFDSAIARLQLLASANDAERARYGSDRVRILGTMDSVRGSNAALRQQLDEARETLARRRRFDELADRITANRMLRPRAEQRQNLRKLADECAELERESADYGDTWRERRGQFGRLVDEGVRLRALIRDEKEEVERREGMDDNNHEDSSNAEDGNGGGSGGGHAGAGAAKSGNATPRPDHLLHSHSHHQHAGAGASSLGSVRGDGEGGATPRPGSSGRDERTPRPDSPAAPTVGEEGLKPSGSFSRAGSQVSSVRGGSQQPSHEEPKDGEDVEMGESATQQQQQQADTPMSGEEETQENGETSGGARETPQITVEAAEAAAGEKDDKMDTT